MQLLFTMGLPAVIIADQGKEFQNQFNAEMMNVLGIKHQLTTANDPQATGLEVVVESILLVLLYRFHVG